MKRERMEEVERQLSEEHLAVQTIIRWMKTELERHRSGEFTSRKGLALLEFLRSFSNHLRRHFKVEETGWFLDASASNPGSDQAVRKLLRDHRGFERRLVSITSILSEATLPRASLPEDFEAQLLEFFADLKRHESVENKLFEKVAQEEFDGDCE